MIKKEEYTSVVDYLKHRDSTRNKDNTVVEYNGNKISRDEYWQRVEHYKKHFESLGFFYGCGKSIAICNLNTPEYEFMYMALLDLGVIVSTVSLSFLKSDIKMHTTEKDAETLVLSAEYINQDLKESLKSLHDKNGKTSVKRIIFTSAGDYRPEEIENQYNQQFNFKEMIDFLDLPKDIDVVYPGQIKNSHFSKVYIPSSTKEINLSKFNATYSNTGGTSTGIPNTAVHTHEAIINLLKGHEPDIFPNYCFQENDKALLVIPISHITSQFYSLLVRRSLGGNIVYNPAAFEPHSIKKAIIEDGINEVIAPFGLYVALAHSNLKPGDLKGFSPGCGGEPIPFGPAKWVNETLGKAGANRMLIGGGSTEFGSTIINSSGIHNRGNETGRVVPGAEVVLLNPKTFKEVKEGTRGILYARSGWQMKEYLNNEAATKGFYNFTDKDGKVWGTNNDVATITGEYKGDPLYTLEGRITDFYIQDKTTKRYFPGATLTKGKADNVDFNDGVFLFDMRDRILNIPGVIEAETVIIPFNEIDKSGTPVVNLVISPLAKPGDIIKAIYSMYDKDEVFIPEGLIFRSRFARSLTTDKRETKSLKEDRGNYYNIDTEGCINKLTIPENGEPIIEKIDDISQVKIVEPPEPSKILIKKI